MELVRLRGFCPIDEPFLVRMLTSEGGEQAREVAYLNLSQPSRLFEGPIGTSLYKFAHDFVPDGGRAGQTRHVVHGFVTAVAYPDSHEKIRGIANRPVIVEIGGCPGFDR